MAQLTKGMYGGQFDPRGKLLFGLLCGQWRGGNTKLAHNNGWYNKSGEKLGWGDLTAEDFRRISSELEESELFIILSEGDSFWKFVKWPETITHRCIGSMVQVEPTVEAPGVDYVAEKCYYIIARNQLYYVDRCEDEDNKKTSRRRGGLRFKILKPEAAKTLIAAYTAV